LSWLEDGSDWNLYAQVDERLARSPAGVRPPREEESKAQWERRADTSRDERLHRITLRELRWFFADCGGRVPASGEAPARERSAAQTIDVWLRAVPAQRREVLALYHGREQRRGSPEIARAYGRHASVVVHNRCTWVARGNAVTEELEQGVVASLTEEVRAQGRVVSRACAASFQVQRALASYIEARGDQPCVLPRGTGRNSSAKLGPKSGVPGDHARADASLEGGLL
jgi:hypothetical protein